MFNGLDFLLLAAIFFLSEYIIFSKIDKRRTK